MPQAIAINSLLIAGPPTPRIKGQLFIGCYRATCKAFPALYKKPLSPIRSITIYCYIFLFFTKRTVIILTHFHASFSNFPRTP